MSPNRYMIVIEGELDALSAYAFDDVALERCDGRTLLRTHEVDQAGLNGVLDRLRAIGAVLRKVELIDS